MSVVGHSLRERLELALIADLDASLAYLKGRVRPYEGELGGAGDETPLDEIKASLNGLHPGVLVATGEARYELEAMSRRRATREIDVQLVIVSRSLRSRSAQRHGEFGAYRILEDVQSRLAGWDAGVAGVGPMRVTGERPFLQEPDLCVWLLTMSAPCDLIALDRRLVGAADLETIAGTVNHTEDVGVLVQGIGDTLTIAAGVMTLVDTGMAAIAGWVGLRVRIESAENEPNEGDFTITAAPSATQIQFANAAGLPETSSFTWKLLAPAPATLTVEVE